MEGGRTIYGDLLIEESALNGVVMYLTEKERYSDFKIRELLQVAKTATYFWPCNVMNYGLKNIFPFSKIK